jgi:hypothetical protein
MYYNKKLCSAYGVIKGNHSRRSKGSNPRRLRFGIWFYAMYRLTLGLMEAFFGVWYESKGLDDGRERERERESEGEMNNSVSAFPCLHHEEHMLAMS